MNVSARQIEIIQPVGDFYTQNDCQVDEKATVGETVRSFLQ